MTGFIDTNEEFVIDGVPFPHILPQPTSLVHRQCVTFVVETKTKFIFWSWYQIAPRTLPFKLSGNDG